MQWTVRRPQDKKGLFFIRENRRLPVHERKVLGKIAAPGEIERAAADWAASGRPGSGLLHREDRLEAAEILLTRPEFRALVGAAGVEYVGAYRDRQTRELAHQARLRFVRNLALATLAIAVAVGGLATAWQF